MGVEIHVEIRLTGSEKPFAQFDLDDKNIRELSKVSEVLEELKKIGKLFGF